MAKNAAKNAKAAKKPSKPAKQTASKPPRRVMKLETKSAKPAKRSARADSKPVFRPGSTGPGLAPGFGIRRPVNVVTPEAPVLSQNKPKKNQAGLSFRELEHYRELLIAKRRELVGDLAQMEREALRSASGTNLSNLPMHMADMGTDNYEQEFTLGLVEKDRQLLREINTALAKIQSGSYGICEGTGKPIGRPRLEAQPWARYSIEYARQMERGYVR